MMRLKGTITEKKNAVQRNRNKIDVVLVTADQEEFYLQIRPHLFHEMNDKNEGDSMEVQVKNEMGRHAMKSGDELKFNNLIVQDIIG